MMSTINITTASVSKLLQIQALAVQSFTETFAVHNTPDNLKAYLDKAFSPEQLTKELKNKHSRWFFALVDDEAAGYLKINCKDAQTEKQDDDAMEIERIYVLEMFQGQNIGKLLLQKAIDVALKNGTSFIWLGVWEKNEKAIRFYQKNGFVKFAQHSFFVGDDKQTDWMMRLEL